MDLLGKPVFGRPVTGREEVRDLERVEALVRDRFGLGGGALVLVSEDVSGVSGGPEMATTVLFWRDGARHRWRVFKPVGRVGAGDLPPRWLAGAIEDRDDAECC